MNWVVPLNVMLLQWLKWIAKAVVTGFVIADIRVSVWGPVSEAQTMAGICLIVVVAAWFAESMAERALP